jgi:hypothetical protein
VLAARATVAGGNADLVIGDVVGLAYARDVHDASMAEVLGFVGDTPIGTTLEDGVGATLPVPVRPSELFASRGGVTTPVTERRLMLPGYAGYELSGDGARPRERLPVGTNDVWYVAAQRVSVADDIVVVFLVPRVFLTMSAWYDLDLMSGVSLILLIVMGLLVWRIVSRFSDPIAYSARLGRPFRQHPATRSWTPGRDRSAATGSLLRAPVPHRSNGTLG